MYSLRRFFFLLLPFAVLALGACSKGEDEDELDARPAEELYTDARDAFAEQKYERAVELFEEVERQHPYSEWAPRAEVMTAYAQYKTRKYDDAVLTLERFIKLHPGNESVAYAYYLTALSYYEQISDVGRDQGMTRKARESLREVVRRYPNTEFARDARLKLDLTEDHLAGKEMMVGRYYLERDEYLSAANRFNRVVKDYQTTSHVPEALHRLVETYLKLGVEAEARRYAAVLGHNFPGSKWYRFSYALLEGKKQPEEEKTWWDVL